MAQGRPPRRSKGKSNPVTIDLEAEKNAESTDTETGKASASDDGVADTGAEVPAGDPENRTEERPAEENQHGESLGHQPTEAAGTASPGTGDAEASAANDQTPSPGPREKAQTAAVNPGGSRERDADTVRGPAGEAAGSGGRNFVAGLVGGVVVVALAFGLEAAGVLPAPGGNQSAATASKVAALGNEVDALGKSVAGLKDNPPQAAEGISNAVDALQAKVSGLSDRLDKLESASGTPSGASASEISDLKNGLSQANSRIDQLSSSVDALGSKVAGAGKESRLAAIVAATALKSSIDRGGPFAAELKVYESVATNDQVSARLKDIADAGVRSREQLVREFGDTADAILSAVRGNGENTGLFDRLVNSARSVVKIRPTGNVSGNSPSAIVARMETMLKAGNLKGVVDEWSSLPAPGQKASQSFIDQVKKRMIALQAADGALQDAMSSTDKQG